MGEDSVIECTADEENINAYHSWNTPLYTNTRVGVVGYEFLRKLKKKLIFMIF